MSLLHEQADKLREQQETSAGKGREGRAEWGVHGDLVSVCHLVLK